MAGMKELLEEDVGSALRKSPEEFSRFKQKLRGLVSVEESSLPVNAYENFCALGLRMAHPRKFDSCSEALGFFRRIKRIQGMRKSILHP